MTLKLSKAELKTVQALLKNYAPAQEAIATLCHHQGDLEMSLIELISAELCTTTDAIDRTQFQDIFLEDIRQELCGNEAFQRRAIAYQQAPEDEQLLIVLIQDVACNVLAPIDLAMATVVVLWIWKCGFEAFCGFIHP